MAQTLARVPVCAIVELKAREIGSRTNNRKVKKMGTIHGTTRDAIKLSDAIDARNNYKSNGALSGEYVPETSHGVAHYVIRSYDEPIAFYTYYDRWAILSEYKHSVTTSRHQSVARRALAYSAKHTQTTRARITANGTEW